MAEPGPSQAGSRLLSGFNCGSSIVCNSIFSLLRPSLTCAINSVNISLGSAPRRRQKEHQEDAHTYTHTNTQATTAPCGHVATYITILFAASFRVNLQFNVLNGYVEILWQLFSRRLFLRLSCFFLATFLPSASLI